MGVMFVRQANFISYSPFLHISIMDKSQIIIFSDKVSTNSISNLFGTNNIAQHNTKLLWLLLKDGVIH